MQTSTEINKLSQALSLAQGSLKSAEKDGVNPHFRSNYATLASVIDTIREPLYKNGLAIIQSPDISEGGIKLVNRLVHESGQWIETAYPIKPVQDTPQAWGSAITYARRYCLMSILAVAAEDDDGTAATQPRTQPPTPEKQFNRPNPAVKPGLSKTDTLGHIPF